MSKKEKVVIVGAGVSGLVAAVNLEKAGFSPIIYDAEDRVGGRVKTDYLDGYAYDKGFQVLLTQYPAAQKYLNYKLLDLVDFKSGAGIFIDREAKYIGDPKRDMSLLFSTVFAEIGSFSDKLKMIALARELKKKDFDAIFLAEEKTTLTYLKQYGFSDNIIRLFFKPFFTGIFLEDELATSSRKFEFVFKMFAEGKAAVPRKGVQAIPNQLMGNLKQTTFHFNTKIDSVLDDYLLLDNGQKIEFDYAIIATEASSLIKNLSNQESSWKSVDNLYFETHDKVLKDGFIGLIPEEKSLVNNFHYEKKLLDGNYLLSVSVVKNHQLSRDKLLENVIQDLKKYTKIESLTFLRHYHIQKALPKMHQVLYMIPASETQLKDRIFLAGDQMANGSLNAAMLNGESAAKAIIGKVEDGFINNA
ncbi:MAG: NAD(P)/FAD-dependent oxidoreductase [Bacteroidota bacterium]